MKITNRRSDASKNFGDLEIGDIFRDKYDGDIMMKINPYEMDEDGKTNCVSLIDGEGYSYEKDCSVTPITDVELIIN